MAVGALIVSSVAQAADFTVSSGQTVTATQSLLGGETGTVESGGKISTTGIGEYGVFAFGANNTIINNGTIETSGGLNAGSGFGADGIHSVADGDTISNSGTISTTGKAGYGINALGAAPTVSNSGTITTTGKYADGIYAYDSNATIINSGTISTTEESAMGIATRFTSTNTTIVNSGTISATGSNSVGILADGPYSTIVNSGTIITSNHSFAAIAARGDHATVTLLPGTAVQGLIVFSFANSATLNIGTGLNTALTIDGGLTPYGFPATINTYGQPYVLDNSTTTLAVVDPTGFAAADRFAFDFAAGVSDTLEARMAPTDGAGVTTGSVPGAASPERHGFWTAGLGFFSDHRAAAPLDGFRYGTGGLMVGVDRDLSASSLAGIFGGLAGGTIETAVGSTRIGAMGAFAGAYWSKDTGRTFAHLSLTAGGFSNTSARTVANNTVTGGLETASASYGSIYVDPAVTVGLHRRVGGTTVSPSLGLSYTGLYQPGHSESGSTADMTVAGRTAHELRIRGQVKTDFMPQVSDAGVGRFNLRAGVDGLFTWAGNVDATLLGQSIGFSTHEPQAAARFYVGAGTTFAAVNGMIFKAGAEAGYDTADTFTLSAHASMHKTF